MNTRIESLRTAIAAHGKKLRLNYYRLSAKSKQDLGKHIVFQVKLFIAKTLFKKVILEYLSFIYEFTNSESTHNSTDGVNYLKITTTLDEKIHKAFPNWYSRYIEKFIYRTARIRFAESEKSDIKDAIVIFLNKGEKMILSSVANSGTGIKAILHQSERSNKLVAIISAALFLPLVELSMLTVLIHLVHPKLIAGYVKIAERKEVELEGSLKYINTIDVFVMAYWPLVISLILIAIVMYRSLINVLRGKSRITLERIPIFGMPFKITRLVNSGLFLQFLATLYLSGITTQRALKILRENATPFMKSNIGEMAAVFSDTGSEVDALNHELFDDNTRYRLSVYFDLVDPTKNMGKIADKIIADIEIKVRRIAWILNIIFLASIAAYLAGLVMSMNAVQDIIGI
ncbi:hypothetical protein [Vibrio sp. Hal054]|uniref:hypothetical protein n=1 Tax=Vibrio sp. Hal054 TaxID=3035158 RepID=UPI00301CF1CF